MVSSASTQIEVKGCDHLKTTIVVDGGRKTVDDYTPRHPNRTASAYITFVTIIGPECALLSPPFHSAVFYDLCVAV